MTFNKDKKRKRADMVRYAAFASGVLLLVCAYAGALVAPQIVARVGALV